jgi:molybdate transport system substrate-binding protein
MKRGVYRFGVIIIVIILLSACNSRPSEKIELTISAAISLTESLKEIQANYEAKNPNVKLSLNLGSSGMLQQQIEQGAPSDLFISAGQKQMQALIDKQLIDEKYQANLLTNELVLIVPTDATTSIKRLEDLDAADVKTIAIGHPDSVPVGNYTKQALNSIQLWDKLQSKLVLAKDVRQVLSYVETGNVDAGLVYKTDALSSDRIHTVLTVDPSTHQAIEYPIGIVKETKHMEEVKKLYNYFLSSEASDIFVKSGFSLPVSS